MKYRDDIRNVAIIAHVDHGKTTMVDALLKQSHVFRSNQAVVECVMDSNPQERERGITIMAKNTAVTYKGVKINIIDTPGHADFSGEVERVIHMADGCLLMIDAVEGPMPQSKYVLKQALKNGLHPIVVINKLDRDNTRIQEVLQLTQDLFLELATTAEQLDFPVLYASGRHGVVAAEPDLSNSNDVSLLFDAILEKIPPPRIEEGPFQLMVSNLDYDSHKGKIAIGRIFRGEIKPRERVACLYANGTQKTYEVAEVLTYMGLKRVDADISKAGDIVAITGVSDVNIGDTLTAPERQDAIKRIEIGEPTVEMTFSVNDSPFAGREGKYVTSRNIRDRLNNELLRDVSLRVADTDTTESWNVAGRGEMHLSILMETMRREGYEFQVSTPRVLYKEIDGKRNEPLECFVCDVPESTVGTVMAKMGQRKGELRHMSPIGNRMRLEFVVPSRGLFGYRSEFLTDTHGEGVMSSVLEGYTPYKGDVTRRHNGSMVAFESGEAVSYGIHSAQERGVLFISPGTPVYAGQIVGQNAKNEDLTVNVCKRKQLTNFRAAGSDDALRLTPPTIMSMEQALEFIADDELLEITPQSLRLRKQELSHEMRMRKRKKAETP